MNVSFLVAPTFSHISYPDDAPVQDAFTQVLAVRKKDDPDGALLQQLEKDGFSTVGSLRAMTDSEWKKVNLPAIARIYLKYLVRQSVRPPLSTNSAGPATSSSDAQFMQVLANEFNFGKPFDPNEYNANLDMLAGMGFSKPESMEAIILTDNRGAEAALEFLIAVKPGQRRQQRLEAALRAGRCAKGYDPRTSPAAPIAAPANTSSEGQVVEKIVEKVIVDDRAVKSAQEKYRKESAKSAQLESENAKLKKEMKKFLDQMGAQVYKEYLRGMIAAKKLSKKQYDALLKYQVISLLFSFLFPFFSFRVGTLSIS